MLSWFQLLSGRSTIEWLCSLRDPTIDWRYTPACKIIFSNFCIPFSLQPSRKNISIRISHTQPRYAKIAYPKWIPQTDGDGNVGRMKLQRIKLFSHEININPSLKMERIRKTSILGYPYPFFFLWHSERSFLYHLAIHWKDPLCINNQAGASGCFCRPLAVSDQWLPLHAWAVTWMRAGPGIQQVLPRLEDVKIQLVNLNINLMMVNLTSWTMVIIWFMFRYVQRITIVNENHI